MLVEQEKRQPKPFRSPRSGAEPKNPHRLKPGETANPRGGSAKQRLKAAFERAVTEEASKGVADTLMSVLRDPDHTHWPQAISMLAKLHSLIEPEKPQEIVVTTEIELSDRSDGSKPKIEVRTLSAQSTSTARTGDADDSIEVEL